MYFDPLDSLITSLVFAGIVTAIVYAITSIGRPRKKTNWKALFVTAISTMSLTMLISYATTGQRGCGEQSSKFHCLSNTKNLALGIIMYSTDYDAHTPLAGNWPAALVPYSKADPKWVWDEFQCKETDAELAYAMNTYATGVSYEDIATPAEIVGTFESDLPPLSIVGTQEDIVYRHNEKANFGFLDGHAKTHNTKHLLNFKIKLRVNPPVEKQK